MTKQYKVTPEDFDRINNDGNGNPRYVVHFTLCIPQVYIDYNINGYASACALMNKIGGRKYHNKSYGGGIAFQSYNIQATCDYINDLIATENKEYKRNIAHEARKRATAYILDCIENDGFENEPYYNKCRTEKAKAKFLHGRFMSEYGWCVDQKGKQAALIDWLQGLALNIHYMNDDILTAHREWNELGGMQLSEKRESAILESYWRYMSMRIISLWTKHKIG